MPPAAGGWPGGSVPSGLKLGAIRCVSRRPTCSFFFSRSSISMRGGIQMEHGSYHTLRPARELSKPAMRTLRLIIRHPFWTRYYFLERTKIKKKSSIFYSRFIAISNKKSLQSNFAQILPSVLLWHHNSYAAMTPVGPAVLTCNSEGYLPSRMQRLWWQSVSSGRLHTMKRWYFQHLIRCQVFVILV